METFLATKFNKTYHTTLDCFSCLSASVMEIQNCQSNVTVSPTPSTVIFQSP
jgi:hypothetical protein